MQGRSYFALKNLNPAKLSIMCFAVHMWLSVMLIAVLKLLPCFVIQMISPLEISIHEWNGGDQGQLVAAMIYAISIMCIGLTMNKNNLRIAPTALPPAKLRQ